MYDKRKRFLSGQKENQTLSTTKCIVKCIVSAKKHASPSQRCYTNCKHQIKLMQRMQTFLENVCKNTYVITYERQILIEKLSEREGIRLHLALSQAPLP